MRIDVHPNLRHSDIIEENDRITVVAKVPGPRDQIKTQLINRTLEIMGSGDYVEKVELPSNAEILDANYKNGVLTLRMRKKIQSQ